MFNQFRKTCRNATHSQNSIAADISCLLLRRGPSAITFFIIALLIWPTINSMPIGAFAHIGKKVLKAVQPAITNHNATAAVTEKLLIIWIRASGFHCHPRIVRSRLAGQRIVPMHQMTFSGNFPFQTAARLRIACQQRFIDYEDKFRMAAITAAKAGSLTRSRTANVRRASSTTKSLPKVFPMMLFLADMTFLFRFATLCKWRHPAITGCRCDLSA